MAWGARENDLCMVDDDLLSSYSKRDSTIALITGSSHQDTDAIPISEIRRKRGKVHLTITNIKKELTSDIKKRYKCDQCDYRGRDPNSMENHKLTHTKEKPYECTVCDKRFSQRGNRDTHMKIHDKHRQFKCKICNKRFVQKNGLAVHLRSHSDDRPYQCDICQKAFHQQGNLDHHMNLHLGNARFHCDICGRKFIQKGQLARHQKEGCIREINSLLFKEETYRKSGKGSGTGIGPGTGRKGHLAIVGSTNDKEEIVEYVKKDTKKTQNRPKKKCKKVAGQLRRKKPEQIEKLEAFFDTVDVQPDKTAIEVIANDVGLAANVVRNWFMNQRAKGNGRNIYQIKNK